MVAEVGTRPLLCFPFLNQHNGFASIIAFLFHKVVG